MDGDATVATRLIARARRSVMGSIIGVVNEGGEMSAWTLMGGLIVFIESGGAGTCTSSNERGSIMKWRKISKVKRWNLDVTEQSESSIEETSGYRFTSRY